ncbi:MAG: hypothetical protein KAH77_06760, partial [Thiomargarita sp.]|nr:hypothetical protein [Thiomargarita sp.]
MTHMNHKKWEYFQIVSLGLLSCLSTTVYAIACTDCFDDAQYSKYSCIQGTLGNDFSLEGDVYFEGENDRICAGNGHDIVSGLFGNDLISGGDGNDTINGNAGNDFINGNIGSDIVHGGQDDDVIRGGKDNDFMYGDLGNDIIYGDEGDDELFDLEGNDIYVYRHNGNITENFHSNGDGCDEIFDDAGNDILWFQDISNLENIKYEESYSNLFLYRRDNRQPIIWIHNHSSTGNIENIRLGTTVTQQTYALTAYLLEVNTFGNGTVTSPIYAEEDSNYNCKFGSGTVNWSESGINCDSDCSESYINGSTVTLTAHP